MLGAPLAGVLIAVWRTPLVRPTMIGFGLVYLACTLSPLVVPAWRDAGRPAELVPE